MSKKEWGFNREVITAANKANAFERKNIDRKASLKEKTDLHVDIKSDKSVFISYARKDLDLVRPFVNRLKTVGVTVEWDQGFLSGIELEEEIRTLIEEATVVIVVWSPISIRSRFVRDEAELAAENGKLAPVMTDGMRSASIPLGFRGLQATRISDFDVVKQSLVARGVELGIHSA
ncbi:MAG: hypothetical protein ACI89J_003035 [Hyphomicrobiaceae bacterium]|jgi:hypothetical protein